MPLKVLHKYRAAAELLLTDLGNGHLWGENLMKLAGDVVVTVPAGTTTNGDLHD